MIDLNDIKKSDIAWFQGKTGFSINIGRDQFILFSRHDGGLAQKTKWDHTTLKVSDIRSFKKVTGIASEYSVSGHYSGLSGSAQQVGQGVGLAIKNAMEKSKAKSNTGIEFQLRSTQMPIFFVQISGERKQDQVIEGFNQLLQDGCIDQKILNIAESVGDSFPSQEILERNKRNAIEKKERLKRLLIAGAVAFPFVVGLVLFQLYQAEQERRKVWNLRNYLDVLSKDPKLFEVSTGESCRDLHDGYEAIFEREGDDATHGTVKTIELRKPNGPFIPTIRGGLVVAIDDAFDTLKVTRNSHYYRNSLPSEFKRNVQLPNDRSGFRKLVRPACSIN